MIFQMKKPFSHLVLCKISMSADHVICFLIISSDNRTTQSETIGENVMKQSAVLMTQVTSSISALFTALIFHSTSCCHVFSVSVIFFSIPNHCNVILLHHCCFFFLNRLQNPSLHFSFGSFSHFCYIHSYAYTQILLILQATHRVHVCTR